MFWQLIKDVMTKDNDSNTHSSSVIYVTPLHCFVYLL